MGVNQCAGRDEPEESSEFIPGRMSRKGLIIMRNRYIVCYDISDPKRLNKIYKKMRGFGDPIQYSIFSCALSAQEKAILVTALSEIIHHREDRIMIINIGPQQGCGEEAIEFMGRVIEMSTSSAVIV